MKVGGPTRAMETIQADAMKLINIKLLSAVEVCDWSTVCKLAERLQELAINGMHRQSIDSLKSLASFAMGKHQESEPR